MAVGEFEILGSGDGTTGALLGTEGAGSSFSITDVGATGLFGTELFGSDPMLVLGGAGSVLCETLGEGAGVGVDFNFSMRALRDVSSFCVAAARLVTVKISAWVLSSAV